MKNLAIVKDQLNKAIELFEEPNLEDYRDLMYDYIFEANRLLKLKTKKFMLQIGQVVEVNTEIQPESWAWEKGYWKIPKGYKTKILDIEKDEGVLIEYIDATFYVDSKFLNGFPQLIYNGKAKGYSLTKGERYKLLWCDKDYYQTINDKGEKQKYAREYFDVLDVN